MRILFLTNHLEGTDGWSRVSLDYARELQNLGFDILCLTHKKSSQREIKETPLLEAPLKYLVNPLRIFSTSNRVKKTVKALSPDFIHFIAEPYVNILPFLGNIKAKTYLTCHGTYSVTPNLLDNFLEKRISHFLSKSYFRRLTGIVAVSNYTKNYLLKYYPETESKTKVIIPGINLERNPLIDLNKKPENKTKKILFVGAVKERKGVLQAIEACKYYRDNISADFIYDIVGSCDESADYYQNLLKKIREYHLEDKIFFRGKVTSEALEKYYLKADLFLMSSLNINHNFEGFGLVFLEANSSGVPCIGSLNSGCQEAILDGKTGYLVDPFDSRQIAQKIDLILNRHAIDGKDCIEWAKENDIKIKIKELINFYHSQS